LGSRASRELTEGVSSPADTSRARHVGRGGAVEKALGAALTKPGA
jgi:hypothetical protein